MAWPTDDLVTTDTDQGTDNPSIARAMINTLLLRVKEIISARGAVNGVCDLDAASKVPVGRLPTGTTASNVAVGNHVHTGTYEPVDATILRSPAIGVSVAPLASPALTGTPTVPTAATATNNTQIASTNFVRNAINDYTPSSTPTTAQVGTATAGLAYKAVGSYAATATLSPKTAGSNYAGSTVGLTSGTWKCMGLSGVNTNAAPGTNPYHYLWLRIA